ncbi:MAG: hypothetical protein L0I97_01105 [Staphylococcus simulans]|nr:hypothetical protein [Staphylococcus simulans]
MKKVMMVLLASTLMLSACGKSDEKTALENDIKQLEKENKQLKDKKEKLEKEQKSVKERVDKLEDEVKDKVATERAKQQSEAEDKAKKEQEAKD